MNRSANGATSSLWMTEPLLERPQPPPDTIDVLVVGAGIAGLTCAVELARRGTRVAVIDDGAIGDGETGRTSAHLASAVDDRYATLEHKFGRDGARAVAESHAAAIDFIERVVRDRRIACAFQRVDGYLFAPPGDSGSELDGELEAARRAGLSCELVAATPLGPGRAIRFADQAEFHPLRYLAGLAAYAEELGATLHTGVHAEGIEPVDGELRVLLRGRGPITAHRVIDATNCDMSSSFQICLQQAPYRSYCIGLELPRESVTHALYWDTAEPYHYVRVADGEHGADVLIVGGEDHRVGQADAGPQFEALERWARERVPAAGAVVSRWSGQIMEPVDGLAHIGASPAIPNVYLCTGDSGNGLTHGTIAGLLIPQLIAGEAAPWSKVYDPARNHAHAGVSYVAEAVRSAAPYLDWIRGGDVRSVDDIVPGTGALVRDGLSICAAYRDGAGACHVMSAVCTHLKGIVQWNATEQSWDCPCHGSRFDAYGTVVNGPALTNLAPLETPLARGTSAANFGVMARGSKKSYTSKQKRTAAKIEKSAKKSHSAKRAKAIAWATVNKQDHGGKKSGSGRGKARNTKSSVRGGKRSHKGTSKR